LIILQILKDYGPLCIIHTTGLINKQLHLFNMATLNQRPSLILHNIKILNMWDLYWVVQMKLDIQVSMVNSQLFHLTRITLRLLMISNNLWQRLVFLLLDYNN
jgi:hypothetical protein